MTISEEFTNNYVFSNTPPVTNINEIPEYAIAVLRARFLSVLKLLVESSAQLPAGVELIAVPFRRHELQQVLRLDWHKLTGSEFYKPEEGSDWMDCQRGHCLPLQAFLALGDTRYAIAFLEAWQFADYISPAPPTIWMQQRAPLDARWARRFAALRRRLHVWWTDPPLDALRNFTAALHRGPLASLQVSNTVVRKAVGPDTGGPTVTYLSVAKLLAFDTRAPSETRIPNPYPTALTFSGPEEIYALTHRMRTGLIVEGPSVLLYLPTYIRALADHEHNTPWLNWKTSDSEGVQHIPGRPLKAVDLDILQSKVRQWFQSRVGYLTETTTRNIWASRAGGRPFSPEDVLGLSIPTVTRFFFGSRTSDAAPEIRIRTEGAQILTYAVPSTHQHVFPSLTFRFVWRQGKSAFLCVSDVPVEDLQVFHTRLLEHCIKQLEPEQPKGRAQALGRTYLWRSNGTLFCRYDVLLKLFPEWDVMLHEFIQRTFNQPHPGPGYRLRKWAGMSVAQDEASVAIYDKTPYTLADDQVVYDNATTDKLITGYLLKSLQSQLPRHSLNSIRLRLYLWKYFKVKMCGVAPATLREPTWIKTSLETVPAYLRPQLSRYTA